MSVDIHSPIRFLTRAAFLFLIMAAAPAPLRAGAGISLFTIFEPAPAEGGVSPAQASAVAEAFHNRFRELLDTHEVWGLELMTLDAATSAARNLLGTRTPRWGGEYTPEWQAILNTTEMITYAALGTVAEEQGRLHARYEIRDFILNHPIAEITATAAAPAEVGQELADKALRALQLYFAEITEVGKGRALINVGFEALSTGTVLTAYAHGHLGAHPPGYTPHGHREEDDHLLGNQVYIRYRNTVPTTATLHTHSRSRWRSLLVGFPPALEHLKTTATAEATTESAPQLPAGATAAAPLPAGATSPIDIMTSPTEEELRLLNLAHFHSGRPTGTLRVTGFVKPHRYFNSYYAVAEVVKGFAVPGGFVRVREEGEGAGADARRTTPAGQR